MRFGLALMIFLHHMNLYPGGGGLAVSLFLVLSGFCFSLGYGERVLREDFSIEQYAKRRMAKFYPIHWFCLLIAILLPWITGATIQLPIKPLIMNAALLQAWIPKDSYYFSYNALSWYVSVALFLALLFPWIYRFIKGLDKRNTIACILAGLGIYAMFYVCVPNELRHPILYINPLFRCFDFVAGIGAAYIYKQFNTNETIRKHPYLIDATIVIALSVCIGLSALLPLRHMIEELYAVYWIPAMVLIIAIAMQGDTLLGKIMKNRVVMVLTQSSFSFFMTHQLIIIGMTGEHCGVVESKWDGLLIFFTVYVVSQLMYYVFEKWLTAKIQQMIR